MHTHTAYSITAYTKRGARGFRWSVGRHGRFDLVESKNPQVSGDILDSWIFAFLLHFNCVNHLLRKWKNYLLIVGPRPINNTLIACRKTQSINNQPVLKLYQAVMKTHLLMVGPSLDCSVWWRLHYSVVHYVVHYRTSKKNTACRRGGCSCRTWVRRASGAHRWWWQNPPSSPRVVLDAWVDSCPAHAIFELWFFNWWWSFGALALLGSLVMSWSWGVQ